MSTKPSQPALDDISKRIVELLQEDGRRPYAEIARVVAGMNLAGRKAAYYGASGAAVAWLKGIVADSDLQAAGADLVAPRPDPQALAAWLRNIA